MSDLSQIRRTCLYCYSKLEDGLYMCVCPLSLCREHFIFHVTEEQCERMCYITCSPDGHISLDPMGNSSIDPAQVADQIATHLEIHEKSLKACKHSEAPTELLKELASDEGCSVCGLKDENLWICTDCGKIGCGRKQSFSNGNGHALEHYQSSKHPIVVAKKSVSRTGSCEAYCYECDKYVLNVHRRSVVSQRGTEKPGCAKEKSSTPLTNNRDYPFVGIVNKGETCYISSTLQLLARALKNENLPWEAHFKLCSMPPLHCLCCQFCKVMNELCREEHQDNVIDISDFLDIFFASFPQFSRGIQEDCNDFILELFNSLEFYEGALLLEKNITELFCFVLRTTTVCDKCNKTASEECKEPIIYVSFSESLQRSLEMRFSEEQTRCSCGGQKTLSTSVVTLPKYMIVGLKRYGVEKGTAFKITSPVEVQGIDKKLFSASESGMYDFVGSVCHFGSSPFSGHYAFWTLWNDTPVLISDTSVAESSQEVSKDGMMFLFS